MSNISFYQSYGRKLNSDQDCERAIQNQNIKIIGYFLHSVKSTIASIIDTSCLVVLTKFRSIFHTEKLSMKVNSFEMYVQTWNVIFFFGDGQFQYGIL